MLEPGVTVGGYRIEGVLGRGGMGVVYEATQLSLDRTVALKLISAELGSDPAFRERFRREGRIQAGMEHPHIVAVHEAGESEHGLFIAMRLISGPNLKHLILARELDPPRTALLLSQVAGALDTAHEAGLIHRDIKPSNVLVDAGHDHAYLADFGTMKVRADLSLTATGQLVGTPDYMAPEQVLGQPATARTDIYALGAVLFECLTGKIPYERDTDLAVLYAHLNEPPPSVTAHAPELPEALDDVIAKAMAKQSDERYATAGALVTDVQRALGRERPRRPVGAPTASAAVGEEAVATRAAAPVAAPAAADDIALLLSERFQGDSRGRAPESSPRHNLPTALTSLVGRERELEAIAEVLGGDRLVTLAGPGGVGKTRLALEVARGQLESRAEGVWFVDLAPKPETPDVAAETARVLAVQTRAGTTPTEALCRYLGNRDLLLVLDNCEQVIDDCAELAATLLTSCPDVRILTTSREPLAVEGETVWRLDPLAPEEANRLFVARARQRRADFRPDTDTQATIGELCERLDRLPLAIELAAARVGVMSPQEILEGLAERLAELGGGRRRAPFHHRSVRAAVEWSYHLLDPVEQEAFRALAVFVGGFDAEAARSVFPRLSLDLLARLVDKSLVAVVQSPGGRTRYRLLETVREYASELLVEAGELEEARERHLSYFSGLADDSQAGWPSPHAAAVVGKLTADYENVRAAIEWAAKADPCAAWPLLAGTKDLFFMLGATDGRRLAEVLLERCPARDRMRAELQLVAGAFAFLVADAEAARSAMVEAQAFAAEVGDRGLEGWAHWWLGLTDTLDGAIEPARQHLEATRALHDEFGPTSAWRRATAVLGLNYLIANEPARARELVEQALAANVAGDDEWGQGQCNAYLGMIAEATAADPKVVTSDYRKAVNLLRPYAGGPLLPVALIGQAGVLARDDPERALRVVAAAYALNERTGGDFSRVYRERAERVRASAEAGAGATAKDAWAEGARLDVDDAIALAFGTSDRVQRQPTG